MVVNKARFKIDASPSEDPTTGDRGVDVTPGQTIAITLEQNPARVLSVTFSLPDVTDEESPYRSINETPQLFDENNQSSITSTDVNATFHITIDPATEMSSYVIRCTTVSDDGTHIYERMVSVRGADLRMTVPAERQEYGNRGWSDAMNEMALAIAGLIAGGAGLLVSGVPALNNVVQWNGSNAVWAAPSALPNIATDRLLGRDTAGTGQPEELSLDPTLEFTGTSAIRRAALTGDVTAAAGSNATTIAAQAVNFTKIQNIATDRLLGRDTAGTGSVEEIALNSTLEWTGANSIQRAALTGDVTAAAGSNVTTIAAGAITLAKMANMNTSRLLGRQTAGVGAVEELTVINGLEFTIGGIQRSALVGDITAAAGSNTTAIAAGVIVDADVNASAAIAFTKLATIATDRLLGRDTAGTGALEPLTVSNGLEFTGAGGIQRSALTGDITAAAGSNTTAIAAGVIVDADVNASAAIALSKLASIITDRLVGRDTAGTGALELLTVTGGLEFNGTGIQRSALTGDVTAAAGSNVTVITAGAVTLSHFANIATDTLLGRDTTGSGPPEALTVGGGLEFTGVGGIQRSALTGDITAAAGSNTTAIAAGAIVDADVNASAAIAHSKLAVISTDSLLGRDTAGTGTLEIIQLNATLSMSGTGFLQRAALTGDVTASAGSNTTAIAAGVIVNADINASAAIAFSKFANLAGLSVLGNSGSSAAPPDAITGTNGQVLVVSGTVLNFGQLDLSLSAAVTGTLSQTRGGTGFSGAGGTANRVFLTTDGTNAVWSQVNLATAQVTGALPLANIAPSGTNGRVLVTTGGVAAWGFALGNSTDAFTYNGASHDVSVAGTRKLFISSTSTTLYQAAFAWDSAVASAQFGYNSTNTAAATGFSLSMFGQDVTGTGSTIGGSTTLRAGNSTNGTGGALDLRSGSGLTSILAGAFTARIGSTIFLSMSGTAPVATVGNFRLPSAGSVYARTNDGLNNLKIFDTSSGDGVFFGDTSFVQSASISTIGARLILGTNIEIQNAAQFRFDSAVTGGVSITHEADATAALATANKFTVSAQNRTGTGATVGAEMELASGTGATAGALTLKVGSTTMMQANDLGSGREVIGLFGAITTTQMPANTGDRVLHWADATTMPTTGFPTSGGILGVSSTFGLSWKGKGGVETTIAQHGDTNTTKRRIISFKTQPVRTTGVLQSTQFTASSIDCTSVNGVSLTNAVLRVTAKTIAGPGYVASAEFTGIFQTNGSGVPSHHGSGSLAAGDTGSVGGDGGTQTMDISGNLIRHRVTPPATTPYNTDYLAWLEIDAFEI